MNERSARAMLGVSPSATTGQIKRAYRRLALQLHPDRGGDALAFQQLVDAQRLLLTISGSPRRHRWIDTSTPVGEGRGAPPRPARRPANPPAQQSQRSTRRFGDVLAEKLAAA